MRLRANSDPLRSVTGEVRPAVLYFYCTAADYADIVRDSAIWVSAGVPAPHPQATHGLFPGGAYASSSAPDVVRLATADFVAQWYGGYPAHLTHFVAFDSTAGWAARGHNDMPAGTAAQFGWHWVNDTADMQMTRGGTPRAAVRVNIVAHGPL